MQPKEWKAKAEAAAAVQKEYDKLTKLKVWDLAGVREYSHVCAEAKSKGLTCHFGRVFPLCHVKHAEMLVEYHSFKGRVVY